jgi:hypothetical protein
MAEAGGVGVGIQMPWWSGGAPGVGAGPMQGVGANRITMSLPRIDPSRLMPDWSVLPPGGYGSTDGTNGSTVPGSNVGVPPASSDEPNLGLPVGPNGPTANGGSNASGGGGSGSTGGSSGGQSSIVKESSSSGGKGSGGGFSYGPAYSNSQIQGMLNSPQQSANNYPYGLAFNRTMWVNGNCFCSFPANLSYAYASGHAPGMVMGVMSGGGGSPPEGGYEDGWGGDFGEQPRPDYIPQTPTQAAMETFRNEGQGIHNMVWEVGETGYDVLKLGYATGGHIFSLGGRFFKPPQVNVGSQLFNAAVLANQQGQMPRFAVTLPANAVQGTYNQFIAEPIADTVSGKYPTVEDEQKRGQNFAVVAFGAAGFARPRAVGEVAPVQEIPKTYNRPSGFRKGVRETVWETAKDSEGVVRDPGSGRIMDPNEPWDMGHKPGLEFRKHQRSALRRKLTRKQFLDECNDPNHYRPELPGSNRSHLGEDLTPRYFGP